MAVQKPGVEQRGIGREKLVLVVWRQDSWCQACVTWDTEGATPVPRRRWYSGCTRSSVCKLTENWEQERRIPAGIWKSGLQVSGSPEEPQFPLLQTTPLHAGPSSTLALQAEHNKAVPFSPANRLQFLPLSLRSPPHPRRVCTQI